MSYFLDLSIEPCQYPLWAKGGHGQTFWGHLLPSPTLQHSGKAIEISLQDGDRLHCSFYEGASDTVVYLFHGLSGDISSDYMQRTAILCQRFGHSVLLVNHRGAGAGKILAKKSYHSGSYQDMEAVFAFGRKSFRNKQHLAVGFSMSGNILLLLLSQAGRARPDAAIAVNSPIQLAKCAYNLKMGFNRVYDLRFTRRLTEQLEERHRLGLVAQRYAIPKLGSLLDVDKIYTAPDGGFTSREDYYHRCSAKPFLAKIRVPTIIISAKDDPFVDWEDYLDAKLSSSTHFHLEKCGGHLGYLSKENTPLGGRRWLDYVLWVYINALRGVGVTRTTGQELETFCAPPMTQP